MQPETGMNEKDGGGTVRLGRKNLLYSMVLAGVMMLFLVGYFICMLPSLYVEDRKSVV